MHDLDPGKLTATSAHSRPKASSLAYRAVLILMILLGAALISPSAYPRKHELGPPPAANSPTAQAAIWLCGSGVQTGVAIAFAIASVGLALLAGRQRLGALAWLPALIAGGYVVCRLVSHWTLMRQFRDEQFAIGSNFISTTAGPHWGQLSAIGLIGIFATAALVADDRRRWRKISGGAVADDPILI